MFVTEFRRYQRRHRWGHDDSRGARKESRIAKKLQAGIVHCESLRISREVKSVF
jgi:hypothetical protein